jgi:isopentenyldiphosphate isomerase
MFFHVKTYEDLKIAPEEAEEFKWVTFEELKTHPNKEEALTDLFERNPKSQV